MKHQVPLIETKRKLIKNFNEVCHNNKVSSFVSSVVKYDEDLLEKTQSVDFNEVEVGMENFMKITEDTDIREVYGCNERSPSRINRTSSVKFQNYFSHNKEICATSKMNTTCSKAINRNNGPSFYSIRTSPLF